MSSLIDTARAYLRFALGLRGFLHNTVTHDEIRTTIRQQIENREENFLKTLKSNVFDYPRSPYLKLFQAANITFPDVEKMVATQGLDGTLDALYDANVYVTFEEYKGRVPLKRGNVELHLSESDFDSPNLEAAMIGATGGSTGKPTRTKMDFKYLAQGGKHIAINRHTHGISDVITVHWFGLLPETTTMGAVLAFAHVGNNITHWFSTIRGNKSNTGWFYIFLTYVMIFMARFHGFKFPFPKHVSIDDPLPIVNTIAEILKNGNGVVMSSTASKCARISLCAQQQGIDLTGVIIFGLSEPSTSAKVAMIEASGAKFLNYYATTETGEIGLPCANPVDHTDVHFMSNHLAMIQRPQEVFDQTVNTFHFTTLLPTSPKTLLNVQLDDYGIVEERDCGCPLHEMGFTTHIRQMSSFRKLTGEGVTLVGSDMVHILEHILPSKFGGSLLDYQLVEEENKQGFTKLVLYVDPSVPIHNENALIQAFLDAMKQSAPSVRLAQAEYQTGDVVSIRREKPIVTSRGKYFPIRTLNIKS
jgi:phenylacetate-coenzyme A ligase PaaK-like adenylate-forming protein